MFGKLRFYLKLANWAWKVKQFFTFKWVKKSLPEPTPPPIRPQYKDKQRYRSMVEKEKNDRQTND